MESKRDRSSNFTKPETRLLVHIVSKHKDIIENKRTDAVGIRDKNETWKIVEEEFNSRSALQHRKLKTLKIKYEALKKGIKKKVAEHKKQLCMTGGRPIDEPKFEDFEEKVLEIINLKAKGLPSKHDSDNSANVTTGVATAHSKIIENETLSENVLDMVMIVDENLYPIVSVDNTRDNLSDISGNSGLSKANEKLNLLEDTTKTNVNENNSKLFSPTMRKHKNYQWLEHLKTKKSSVQYTNRPRTTNKEGNVNKFNELADAKRELVSLQIDALKQENEKKKVYDEFQKEKAEEELKFLRQERKLRIEILKKELEEKEAIIQRNNEIHQLRMKILHEKGNQENDICDQNFFKIEDH